jgi:hypothetical protein
MRGSARHKLATARGRFDLGPGAKPGGGSDRKQCVIGEDLSAPLWCRTFKLDPGLNPELTVPRNDKVRDTFQLEIIAMIPSRKQQSKRPLFKDVAEGKVRQMVARVIQLSEVRARRSGAPAPVMQADAAPMLDGAPDLAERFHFWTGASGRRYVHTVYSLIECPALAVGNYVLVRRDANGDREVLSIGSAIQDAPSLNLAEIRRRGAELGANEVHVHLLAGTSKASKLVEYDLRTGQMQTNAAGSTARH